MGKYKVLGYLVGGLAVAFGRYPISWLLSSRRSYRAPKTLLSPNRFYITCPGGNTMHVELDGPKDAQALVLIHGLNSSSRQWCYQRLFFRSYFRLIIVDLPGHGRSPGPADLSVPVLAADLSYILKSLKINTPILYGHSMGAMLAMQYCTGAYLPKATGVILQHGSYTDPFRTTPFSPFVQMLKEPVLKPFFYFVKRHPLIFALIGRLNYLNGLSLLFYRFLFFAGGQTPAQLMYMSRIAALNPPEVTAEGLLKCMEFDVTDSLKDITVPALVLGAKYDRLIEPQVSKYMLTHLNKGRLVMINGGHQSIIEVPDEVNNAVMSFISTGIFK